MYPIMAQAEYKEAIQGLFSTTEELDQFLVAAEKSVRKSIKILLSRMSIDTFTKLAQHQGRDLVSTIFRDDIADIKYVERTERKIALGKSLLHLLGFCYMQEVAASLPAHIISLPENGLVLDMSAAPGGKTVQLADALLSLSPTQPGLVRANDPDRKRISTRASNIQRCAMYNTCATTFDGMVFGTQFPETFDAVLLDAPCSGEGTAFKSDSALQRRRIEEIKKIAGLQYKLFESAVRTCKVGGSIVYSTCTTNPRENEKNIQKILADYDGRLELEDIVLTNKSKGVSTYEQEEILTPEQAEKLVRCRPHIHHTGGFFVAKLRKTASTNASSSETKRKIPPTQTFVTSTKIQKDVRHYCKHVRGMDIPSHYLFADNGHGDIHVTTDKFHAVVDMASYTYVGIPILKRVREGFVPLHSFGAVLGSFATQNIISFADENMQKYSWHESIFLENPTKTSDDFKIIQRHNIPVTVCKYVGNECKNKFMKW